MVAHLSLKAHPKTLPRQRGKPQPCNSPEQNPSNLRTQPAALPNFSGSAQFQNPNSGTAQPGKIPCLMLRVLTMTLKKKEHLYTDIHNSFIHNCQKLNTI